MSIDDFNATELAKLDPEVVSALITADSWQTMFGAALLAVIFVLALMST